MRKEPLGIDLSPFRHLVSLHDERPGCQANVTQWAWMRGKVIREVLMMVAVLHAVPVLAGATRNDNFGTLLAAMVVTHMHYLG